MGTEEIIEKRNESAITVGDLIKKLSEYPADQKIWAAGCDCINPVVGVVVEEGDPFVMIEVSLG